MVGEVAPNFASLHPRYARATSVCA